MTTVLFITCIGLIIWNVILTWKIRRLDREIFILQLDNAHSGIPTNSYEAGMAMMRQHLEQHNPEGLRMYDEYTKEKEREENEGK